MGFCCAAHAQLCFLPGTRAVGSTHKTGTMSMIFDEYGRPFIILREQQAQARIRGKEAQKVNNMDCRRK